MHLGLPEYFLWNVWNFLLGKFSVYTPSSVEVLLFAKADQIKKWLSVLANHSSQGVAVVEWTLLLICAKFTKPRVISSEKGVDNSWMTKSKIHQMNKEQLFIIRASNIFYYTQNLFIEHYQVIATLAFGCWVPWLCECRPLIYYLLNCKNCRYVSSLICSLSLSWCSLYGKISH